MNFRLHKLLAIALCVGGVLLVGMVFIISSKPKWSPPPTGTEKFVHASGVDVSTHSKHGCVYPQRWCEAEQKCVMNDQGSCSSFLPVMPTELGDNVNGRHIGRIIYLSSTSPATLNVKYALIPTCKKDAEYCPDPIEAIYVPSNSILRTFPLSKNVVVYLQTYEWTSEKNFYYNEVVPLKTFKEVFDSPTTWTEQAVRPPYDPKKRFFWITLSAGEVTEITEQYQP